MGPAASRRRLAVELLATSSQAPRLGRRARPREWGPSSASRARGWPRRAVPRCCGIVAAGQSARDVARLTMTRVLDRSAIDVAVPAPRSRARPLWPASRRPSCFPSDMAGRDRRAQGRLGVALTSRAATAIRSCERRQRQRVTRQPRPRHRYVGTPLRVLARQVAQQVAEQDPSIGDALTRDRASRYAALGLVARRRAAAASSEASISQRRCCPRDRVAAGLLVVVALRSPPRRGSRAAPVHTSGVKAYSRARGAQRGGRGR